MPPPADHILLQQFATQGSRQAFEKIVARHAPLVRGAIQRRLRDPGLTEDATQAVFLALAQKAHAIGSHTPLASWLLKTARFAAIDLLRKEARHARHSRNAATDRPESVSSPPSEGDPRLAAIDDALLGLTTADREALLLRFYQDQPLANIALAMGTTPEGARKRIARALARIRKLLASRGTVLSATAVAALLASTHSAAHASATLLPSIASARASVILQGILNAWTRARLQLLAAISGPIVVGIICLLPFVAPQNSDPIKAAIPLAAHSTPTLDNPPPPASAAAPKLSLAAPLHSRLFLALVSTSTQDLQDVDPIEPQPASRTTCLVLGIQWSDALAEPPALDLSPLHLTLGHPPDLAIAHAPTSLSLSLYSPEPPQSRPLPNSSSTPIVSDSPAPIPDSPRQAKIFVLAVIPLPQLFRN